MKSLFQECVRSVATGACFFVVVLLWSVFLALDYIRNEIFKLKGSLKSVNDLLYKHCSLHQ